MVFEHRMNGIVKDPIPRGIVYVPDLEAVLNKIYKKGSSMAQMYGIHAHGNSFDVGYLIDARSDYLTASDKIILATDLQDDTAPLVAAVEHDGISFGFRITIPQLGPGEGSPVASVYTYNYHIKGYPWYTVDDCMEQFLGNVGEYWDIVTHPYSMLQQHHFELHDQHSIELLSSMIYAIYSIMA